MEWPLRPAPEGINMKDIKWYLKERDSKEWGNI